MHKSSSYMLLSSRITCILFLFVVPFLSKAQEVMDLNACIDYALRNNIMLQQTMLANEQQESQLRQAKAEQFPSLSLNAGQGYNFGRTIDPFTNEFLTRSIRTNNFSLNSNWLAFQGFSVRNNIRSAKMQAESAAHEINRAKNEVYLNVTNFYIEVLKAQEQVKRADSLYENAKNTYERATYLVSSGQENEIVELEAEAQMANDESLKILAENDLEMAYLRLKQFMNWNPTKPMEVVEVPVDDELEAFEEDGLERALNQRLYELPEYKAAEANIQAAIFALKSAKGRRWFSFNVNASLNTGYSNQREEITDLNFRTDTLGFLPADNTPVVLERPDPVFSTISFADQIENNFGQTINFGINIPIFNNYQIKNSIRIAEIQQQRSELEIEDLKNQLTAEVYEAYVNVKNAYKRYLALDKNKKAQARAFEQNDVRYKEGLLSFFEWRNSRILYTEALVDFVNAKYDYVFAEKIYRFYLDGNVDFN